MRCFLRVQCNPKPGRGINFRTLTLRVTIGPRRVQYNSSLCIALRRVPPAFCPTFRNQVFVRSRHAPTPFIRDENLHADVVVSICFFAGCALRGFACRRNS